MIRLLSKRRNILLAAASLLAIASPLNVDAGTTFTGALSDAWSVASNWNPADVPGDSLLTPEDAVILSGAPRIDDDFAIRDLLLSGGRLYGLTGNSLKINGVLMWNGGTIDASAAVLANGSVHLAGTLNNHGLLDIAISSGTIEVDSLTTLNNHGALHLAGGSLILVNGISTGTIDAAANSTVNIAGGGYTFGTSALFNGDGTLLISSTATIQSNLSAKNVRISGAVKGGTLNITRAADWTRGDMLGGGQTAVAPAASLLISSTQIKSLANRELANDGSLLWTGGDIFLSDGAILRNRSVMEFAANAVIRKSGAVATQFVNVGTLIKSSAGLTEINIPLQSSGTVQLVGGTMSLGAGAFTNGSWNVTAGSQLRLASSGVSPVIFGTSAVVNNFGQFVNAGFMQAPATLLVGQNLVMDSTLAGELNVIGDLPVSEITWNRGVLSGVGVSVSSGTLRFDTAASQWGVAGGRTLENQGVLEWSAGAWGLGSADTISVFDNLTPGTIQNDAGATFSINHDTTLGLSELPGALNLKNEGRLEIGAGRDVNLYGSINNSGVTRLGAGATLRLWSGGASSGVYDLGGDATLQFRGDSAHTIESMSQIKSVAPNVPPANVMFDADDMSISGIIGQNVRIFVGGENPNARFNIQNGATINADQLWMRGGLTELHPGATVNVTQTHLALDGGDLATLRVHAGANFSAGAMELQGPALLDLDSGVVTATSLSAAAGSTIIGSGTIDVPEASLSAVVTPGVEIGDVGNIHFTGDLNFSSSSIVGIDINADSHTNDIITVAGELDLASAILFVTISGNPGSIGNGERFTILTSASHVGTFTIDLPTRVFAYDTDSNQVGAFEVGYADPLKIELHSFVPEPSTLWAAPLAGALLLRRRRCQTGST